MNYKNTVFSMFFAFALGGTSLSLAMMERKEEPSKKTSQTMTPDEYSAMRQPLRVGVPQVQNNQRSVQKSSNQKSSIKNNEQQKLSNQKQVASESKQHVKQTPQTNNEKFSNVSEKKQASHKQPQKTYKQREQASTKLVVYLPETQDPVVDIKKEEPVVVYQEPEVITHHPVSKLSLNPNNRQKNNDQKNVQQKVVAQQDQLVVNNFEEQLIKEVSSQQSQKNQQLSLREQSELRLQDRKEDEKVIQEKGSRSCQGARSKVHYYVASSKINIMQEELDLARKEISKNFTEDIKGIKGFLPRNRMARLAREAFLRNTSSSYDVNTKFLDNWVPLFDALEDNDIKSMKLLLKKNVDINASDNYGNSLLHYAAIHSTPEMVKFLLDEGIDINAKDKIQQTPLFIACRDGKDDIVKILLERGAEVDTKNVCTPVLSKFPMKSTLNSNVIKEEIRYFTICPSVAHNAYPQAEEGYSPLHVASYNGHDKIVDLLLQNKVNKVEVDAKSNNHITSLHLVALRGHAKIAEKLRIAGADVDAETIDTFPESMFMAARVTPLVLATVYERTDVVEKLALWANVDYQVGDFKATALHFASSEGYSDIAKILIKNNAKIELPLWGKHTAVDVANHYGKKDIAESLTATMKSLKEMLWSSKVKNQQASIKIMKSNGTLQKAIISQPKLNIRADRRLIDACTIEGLQTQPSFEFSCSSGNDCVLPGVYYRGKNGQIQSVEANLKTEMVENHLSNLDYFYCPKMRIKGDVEHSFPKTIEKNFGHQGCVVIDITDPRTITDRQKKFDLFVTIPGKMEKEGELNILKSKQGVFEFKVRKSLYDQHGFCYHRLFNKKGEVGAQGFGKEFREKKQKKSASKLFITLDEHTT